MDASTLSRFWEATLEALITLKGFDHGYDKALIQ